MRRIITLSVLLLVIFIAGYIYWYYYNPFSDGYRDGVLQKFSRKGNVFKTYEGEMVLLGFGQRNGAFNANYFYFSVTDKGIADSMNMMTGKLLKVHYVQYRRSLPWRGDNYNGRNSDKGQYIVDHIAEVQSAPGY